MSARTTAARLLIPTLAVVYGATTPSCSKGGDQRQLSTGYGVESVSTSSATGAATPTPTPTPTTAGTSSLVDASVVVGPTLAQCAERGLAWEPAAATGSIDQCGDPLATWCCSQAEISQRFPKVAAELESQYFQPLLGEQGFQLYACSIDASGNYTLHMGRTDEDSGVQYRSVSISGSSEVPPAQPNSCAAMTKLEPAAP